MQHCSIYQTHFTTFPSDEPNSSYKTKFDGSKTQTRGRWAPAFPLPQRHLSNNRIFPGLLFLIQMYCTNLYHTTINILKIGACESAEFVKAMYFLGGKYHPSSFSWSRWLDILSVVSLKVSLTSNLLTIAFAIWWIFVLIVVSSDSDWFSSSKINKNAESTFNLSTKNQSNLLDLRSSTATGAAGSAAAGRNSGCRSSCCCWSCCSCCSCCNCWSCIWFSEYSSSA